MTDTKRIAEEITALLPRYDVSFSISHNENRAYYETVEEYFWHADHFDIDDAERAECIATDSVWVAQWYPDTPVGFCAIGAPTLARLLEKLNPEVKR